LNRIFRASLLATAVLALAAAPAAAGSSTTFEGRISIGHPTTFLGLGVTELFAPCDEASELNGVDGVWFEVAGLAGADFLLTMEQTLDADVYFYDDSCSFLEADGGADNFFDLPESGTVPPGAEYAIVTAFTGFGAFTLTLTTA